MIFFICNLLSIYSDFGATQDRRRENRMHCWIVRSCAFPEYIMLSIFQEKRARINKECKTTNALIKKVTHRTRNIRRRSHNALNAIHSVDSEMNSSMKLVTADCTRPIFFVRQAPSSQFALHVNAECTSTRLTYPLHGLSQSVSFLTSSFAIILVGFFDKKGTLTTKGNDPIFAFVKNSISKFMGNSWYNAHCKFVNVWHE